VSDPVRAALLQALLESYPSETKTPFQQNQQSWPSITAEEIEMVIDLLVGRELSLIAEDGIIETFAAACRAYFGSQFVLPQNSGTATLHSAFFALGLQPDDEVLVPSATFFATVSALAMVARPVFCEIDPSTLTLSADDLESRITGKTKAVCVVHLHGLCADLERIQSICRPHQLPLIEDCSEAHGATWHGRPVGTVGNIGCFSLQREKGFTAGEGGLFVTDDPDLYDRALVLGHFNAVQRKGATAHYKGLVPVMGGPKYRIHPLAAGIALVQLKRFPQKLEKCREYCTKLERALDAIDGVTSLKPYPGSERGAYQRGFVVAVERLRSLSAEKRTAFFNRVMDAGVWAAPPFPMVHLSPRFRGQIDYRKRPPYSLAGGYEDGSLPITEGAYPTYVVLDQHVEDIDSAVNRTSEVLKKEIGRL
jgi:dTDP-4-amino-4,6-dideoxygalactose transaminase